MLVEGCRGKKLGNIQKKEDGEGEREGREGKGKGRERGRGEEKRRIGWGEIIQTLENMPKDRDIE